MTKETEAPTGAFGVDDTPDISTETIGIVNYLASLTERHGTEYVTSMIATVLADKMSYKEVKCFSRDLEVAVAQTINNAEGYVAPPRFETKWGVDGMVAILKQNMTPENVYEYIAEKHNTPLELVDNLSSKRFYNQQEILDEVDVTAKTQVNKLKRKRIYRKRELAKTSTPNDMFNNTYDNMLLWAEIDGMKKELKELRKEQIDTNKRVAALEDKIVPVGIVSKGDKKRIVMEMIEEGTTQQVISETLKIPIRTVKRWIAESKTLQNGTTKSTNHA